MTENMSVLYFIFLKETFIWEKDCLLLSADCQLN